MDATVSYELVWELVAAVMTWIGIFFVVIGLVFLIMGMKEGDGQKTHKASKTFYIGIGLLAGAAIVSPVGWWAYEFLTEKINSIHT